MTDKHRILLVEDEEHLREAITLNLEMEGYIVSTESNGKSAVDTFRSGRFDLVVLDVMIPDMDGFTVCQTIRLEDQLTPILFLTAKDSSQDRVQGLKIGADDYLTKPFNLEELLLRIQILIRRNPEANKEEPTEYTFSDGSINFLTYEIVDKTGEKKLLSKKEISLLKLLIDRQGEVVSREQILESVWGYDVYPSTRTIDNFVVNFRKYFEQDPRRPKHFISVRGVGYKFASD